MREIKQLHATHVQNCKNVNKYRLMKKIKTNDELNQAILLFCQTLRFMILMFVLFLQRQSKGVSKMAPGKSLGRRLKQAEKELTLWDQCEKAPTVPSSYISMSSAERNFGIQYKVCIFTKLIFNNFFTFYRTLIILS